MRISTESATTTTGTIDRGGSTAMSIDANGMAHIMSVLTNLYSDKNLAVLREYATNALDSHVAAGQTRPIEVTLPSDLNPTLVIQDFGVGLSEAEIINVYSRYGASTKRDSNDQVGAFGLGCKSGFTIASQFIVAGVKDGRRTTALFAVDETGVGTVTVLGRSDTDDPNGVTVSIGVSEPDSMSRVAGWFFSAWRPGTVLVNGKQPVGDSDATELSDTVRIVRDGEFDGLSLVMGSVPYPVSRSLMDKAVEHAGWEYGDALNKFSRSVAYSSSALLVDVPIGSVDITPSREGLRDTDRTVAAVAVAIESAYLAVRDYVDNRVDETETLADGAAALAGAMKAVGRLVGSQFFEEATWHGNNIPLRINVPLTSHFIERKRASQRRVTDHGGPFILEQIPSVLVVTGVPDGKNVARPSRNYLLGVGDASIIVETPETSGAFDWFVFGDGGPIRTMPYEEFVAAAKASAPAPAKRSQTMYAVAGPDGTRWGTRTADEIVGMGVPVVFRREGLGTTVFDQKVNGAVVVTLTSRQSPERFVERVPGAIDGNAAAKDAARAFLDGVESPDELGTLAADQVEAGYVRKMFGALADRIDSGCVLGVWLAHVDAARARLEASADDADALTRKVQQARRMLGIVTVGQPERRRFVDEHLPLLSAAFSSLWQRRYDPSDTRKALLWEHLVGYVNSIRP